MDCTSSLLALFFVIALAAAADPDGLQDFCIPKNGSTDLSCDPQHTVVGEDFASNAFVGMKVVSSKNAFHFIAVDVTNFPGLNTMGVSAAKIGLGPGGVARAHVHPRSSELVYVESGNVEIGFIDTNNKVYAQKVGAGGLFVIPRGVLHYLHNSGDVPVVAVAFLNSQKPDFQVPSFAMFHQAIPDRVVEATFDGGLNSQTITGLRKIYSRLNSTLVRGQ